MIAIPSFMYGFFFACGASITISLLCNFTASIYPFASIGAVERSFSTIESFRFFTVFYRKMIECL